MILASGCFDGLHWGHVAYLEAAKALCTRDELLICAVAPDAYIRLRKGRAPYWSRADRDQTVKSLSCVDATVVQHEHSVAALIYEHRPRILAKGIDWRGQMPEDVLYACGQVGTSCVYLDTPGTHTADARPTNAAALAALEAIVSSQTPAVVPWTPVTDYGVAARQRIEGPHPQLIKQAFSTSVSILDVGCGPGILVQLLRGVGLLVQGIDKHLPDGHAADCFTYDIATQADVPVSTWTKRYYDVVICREVLEHLTVRELRKAVTNLCAISLRFVYVTTRFVHAPAHFLSVDTHDDLDPTHITMLNIDFLRALFVLEGLTRRPDLESLLDWKHLGRCVVYEHPDWH